MHYLVNEENEVIGTTDRAEDLPNGIRSIESDLDLSPDQVYVTAEGEIAAKPASPGDGYRWIEGDWAAPLENDFTPANNWPKLEALLMESAPWDRVYQASGRTIKSSAAFTLLLNTITVSRRLQTLEFAIGEMRSAMAGLTGIGDFTAEEIAEINGYLEAAKFDLRLEE